MKVLIRVCAASFVLGAAALGSPSASALTLSTQVAPIYQVSTGSVVSMGHSATATTSYNWLHAGGEFSAACPGGMPPSTGRNYQTKSELLGGLKMTVLIPAVHPGLVSMSAFYSVPRGQTLQCVYNWISKAEENGLSIGGGGIGFQVGFEKKEEGGSQPFTMKKPSLGGDDGATCIP